MANPPPTEDPGPEPRAQAATQDATPQAADAATRACRATHLWWGFAALALFALGGLVLEALHAFKQPAFVDPAQETRRLLWRLAHAHGTLLGLLNVAFGLAAPHLRWPRGPQRAGRLLRAATVLLPAGFALGGVVIYGGDPGPGALLAPVGGGLLAAALVLTAQAAWRGRRP